MCFLELRTCLVVPGVETVRALLPKRLRQAPSFFGLRFYACRLAEDPVEEIRLSYEPLLGSVGFLWVLRTSGFFGRGGGERLFVLQVFPPEPWVAGQGVE